MPWNSNHFDEVYGDRQFTSLLWAWQVTDRLLLELDYENQQRETTNYSGIGLYNFASVEEAKRLFNSLDADTFVGATWAPCAVAATGYSGNPG